MTNTYRADRDPGKPWVHFTQTWGNKAGLGRYWKRRLSKARRQLGKQIIAYELGETARVHARGFVAASSEVNWRTW